MSSVCTTPLTVQGSDGSLSVGAAEAIFPGDHDITHLQLLHRPDGEGRLLWEEKAAGSFGATKAGVTEGLINRIKQKLQEHVGDACLPHHAQTAVGR